MIVCPLCEHRQPHGDACAVCGRRLEAPAGEIPAAPPLEGLEPTGHPAADELAVAPLDGLEPTLLDAGGAATDERAEPGPRVEMELELEPTRTAPVEVEASPLPDVEPTSIAAPDARTPLPAFATCRYCRSPALPGERRCGRCGMRLPLVTTDGEGGASAEAEVRRCSCGAPAAGAICPACGGRIPSSLDG